MNVALVTCAALPGLAPDDRLLLDALTARGCAAEPVVWEDPHFDWAVPRVSIVRSTWDYAYRRAAFLEWARGAAGRTILWNPFPVVEWNTHKAYLADLERKGVPVVPTRMLRVGERVRLGDVIREEGWESVVLKAAVAQTGRYLKHVSGDRIAEGQDHLDRLLPHEDMLVQQYLPAVTTSGEVSIVFVDGAFSHAVRKTPASGDFRVHHDFGGDVRGETPTDPELAVAMAAVDAVPFPLMYARVDLVLRTDGTPCVMELELVEPELFFRCEPEAAPRLAGAIAALIDQTGVKR